MFSRGAQGGSVEVCRKFSGWRRGLLMGVRCALHVGMACSSTTSHQRRDGQFMIAYTSAYLPPARFLRNNGHRMYTSVLPRPLSFCWVALALGSPWTLENCLLRHSDESQANVRLCVRLCSGPRMSAPAKRVLSLTGT